ncbi:hypothetical protein PWT90_03211 [Aphanocladium album]|nr:hypothetical protein PWT90_03211 [Aphanocladium album]
MADELNSSGTAAGAQRRSRRLLGRETSYGQGRAMKCQNPPIRVSASRSSRKSNRLARMQQNRQTIVHSPESNVTLVASEGDTSPSPDIPNELQVSAPSKGHCDDVVTYALTPPGLVQLLPEHRGLLEYFQHGLCPTICTNPYRVQEFCATMLPIAYTNQCALAAVLSLSLSYRSSVTTDPIDGQKATKMCLSAVRQLRESLNTPLDGGGALIAVAASLLLSVGNMFSFGAPKTWHVYLDGALALREQLKQHHITSQSECLRRWCRFLKLITFNSDSGDIKSAREHDWTSAPNCICDLSGISPSLSPLLERIREFCRRHNADKTLIHDVFSQVYFDYIRLLNAVITSLRRRSGIIQDHATLSAEANRDLWLLDEAYHHVALLQLHLCMHTAKTPLTRAIRASVHHIIDCIGGMNLTEKPNYAAYTLNPLRQACKSATVEEDKEMLRALIKKAQACVPIASFTKIQRYLY